MKTVKTAISMLISLAIITLLPFSAIAATNHQATPYDINENDIIIQPFYVNINTTYLSRGSTWIYADFDVKSKMSLRLDIKVYKNGSLDYSSYATANDTSCAIDVDYNFIKGVSYRVDATYKAGTETVPKSMSFTAVSDKSAGHGKIRKLPISGKHQEQRRPKAKENQAYRSWCSARFQTET